MSGEWWWCGAGGDGVWMQLMAVVGWWVALAVEVEVGGGGVCCYTHRFLLFEHA